MARTRISTTVDAQLLDEARRICGASTDAGLIDAALNALIERTKNASIDFTYENAYTEQPIDTTDEWGDLASFRRVAGATSGNSVLMTD